MKSDSLTIFSRAAVLLAEADTIQKARELKDMAIVAGEWAKRKKMGEEAITHCRSYALEAERKMGQMLAVAEKAKGVIGRDKKGMTRGAAGVPRVEDPPTLAALGLTKKESSNAQTLASLPAGDFEQVKAGRLPRATAVNEQRKKKRRETLKETEWPDGKYRVIYADPPWTYNDQRLKTQAGGGASGSYETEPLESICKRSVSEIALKDSVLFLWVTSPMLPCGLEVIESWGFTYKSSFVWDKGKGFNGHYNNVCHEFLLIGTKGSCTPDIDELFSSVIREKRAGHSKKPSSVRDMIAKMYPEGRRIELYARDKTPGWDVWGNEV